MVKIINMPIDRAEMAYIAKEFGGYMIDRFAGGDLAIVAHRTIGAGLAVIHVLHVTPDCHHMTALAIVTGIRMRALFTGCDIAVMTAKTGFGGNG